MFSCICMCCTGHTAPAAGLGDGTGMEFQVEHLEGWSVCYAADREHGEHSAGHIQKTLQAQERTKGQFSHSQFGFMLQGDGHGLGVTCVGLGLVSYK